MLWKIQRVIEKLGGAERISQSLDRRINRDIAWFNKHWREIRDQLTSEEHPCVWVIFYDCQVVATAWDYKELMRVYEELRKKNFPLHEARCEQLWAEGHEPHWSFVHARVA